MVVPSQVDETGARYQKVIHLFLLFIFLWQYTFRVSDNAVAVMLAFIPQFFVLLSAYLNSDSLQKLGRAFPNTLYRAKKALGRLHEQFQRYASCPACHKLYRVENCIIVTRNGRESVTCSFKHYPRHRQARMRLPCGRKLLKTMRSSRGTIYLAPFQTYCYKSVITSLQDLLNRPNVIHMCESWRNRRNKPGILCDVYDGEIWKHFQTDQDGLPFLSQPHNYLLMLNCDWFQPFDHTTFSVGVLYMVVQNLLRGFRFKRDNFFVVGVIPGPSEPSMNINMYLKPLVDDLKQLWTGVTLVVDGESKRIRAALSCLACDVPAARKVGGFLGHRARRGCSRCFKEFPTDKFTEIADYSGFDKSEWEVRSHAIHVHYAILQEAAETETERKGIEYMSGARYSVLYDLPYYHAISSCIIDPMHLLFLGIAILFCKIWVAKDILNEKQFSDIQSKVDSFNAPPDIGRIPYKINSKFSGMKADQWKNWTLYFSLFSLKDVLPAKHYDCWLSFVKICSKICRRSIELSELDKIDERIQEFCEHFESLYKKTSLTPNIHLLGHITDCIRDHGPVYAFWLYAFERMNGVLGSFHTNNHNVTVQLMRKFVSMQLVSTDQWPGEFRESFGPLLQPHLKEKGSVAETVCPNEMSAVKPLPPFSEAAFTDDEILKVEHAISSLHPAESILQILKLYKRTVSIAIGNSVKLASTTSRYSHCSKIFIRDTLYEIDSFVKAAVMATGADSTLTTEKHWLVRCFKYVSHQCKPWFGYPTQVWDTTYEIADPQYFLLSEIGARAVFVQSKVSFGRVIGNHTVLVAVPIPFYLDDVTQQL